MGFNKSEVIKQFRSKDNDTGSPVVQIAIFTASIRNLTKHLQEFKKDFSSRRGLMKIISKRRRLLNYLKNKDGKSYQAVLKMLDIKR